MRIAHETQSEEADKTAKDELLESIEEGRKLLEDEDAETYLSVAELRQALGL